MARTSTPSRGASLPAGEAPASFSVVFLALIWLLGTHFGATFP
ncbi:MAG TPA: hypothetical protein VFH30_00600 [Acidimicrobiales bacterium]|nr:hypothetical protein [Acidimicrobiales bacterium]